MLYNARTEVFMLIPEWTTPNLILYISLASMAFGVGPIEYFGQTMMQYSKFNSSGRIPTRVGMFILYFFPILALSFSAREYIFTAAPIQWIVFAAIFLHFFKRVLESLFLHRYSGAIHPLTMVLITSFYSTTAFLIGWLNQTPIPHADAGLWAGMGVYLAGMIGNFYHHKLLADLRKNSLEYHIPRGGLFEFVICPHYLFEIFIWLGIALLSRHLAALLILLFVVSYLTARSIRTLNWYHKNFKDFPKDRKAILPFVL